MEGRFGGQGGETETGFGRRGEKKRTMGTYTYVYDAEREERKRMAEKRKYGLKKRAALIHEGRRGKNLLGVGFREEIWRFR
jgi:hypothetical protein